MVILSSSDKIRELGLPLNGSQNFDFQKKIISKIQSLDSKHFEKIKINFKRQKLSKAISF